MSLCAHLTEREEAVHFFFGAMKLLNHLRNLNNGITIHHHILRNRFHPLFFNYPKFFSDSSLPQQPTTPHVQQPPPPSSLNRNELAKFAAIAETWWDSEGPFKPLHVMNPTRLAFVRSALCRHFKKDPYSAKPLEGLKIVDVGCGGGILSEPLARMGATVTGVDAVEKNINIARLHAESDPTTSTIEFCCTTAGMYANLNCVGQTFLYTFVSHP